MTAILWLRRDLRLADNPALRAVLAGGLAAVPVFVWGAEEEGEWAPGTASRWWLHQSLEELRGALEGRGSRLVVRRGPLAEALVRLARECGASAVFWNGRGGDGGDAGAGGLGHPGVRTSWQPALRTGNHSQPRWRPIPGIHGVL